MLNDRSYIMCMHLGTHSQKHIHNIQLSKTSPILMVLIRQKNKSLLYYRITFRKDNLGKILLLKELFSVHVNKKH